MGIRNYELAQNFARDIIQLMNLETQRLALVSLCRLKSTATFLSEGRKTKEWWLKRLRKMTYVGRLTRFGRALHFIRNVIFSKEKGARKHVPK